MSSPLLSIIIPVYNTADYLYKCLHSVLGQTYTHIEVIIVDDASTDGSQQIIMEYAKKDARVRHLIQTKNQGQGVARNRGLDIAQGTYIGFIDSDDYIAPTMYEQLMKAILATDSDMVICDTFREKGVLNSQGDSYVAKENIFRAPISFCPVNKVYKKAIWQQYNIRFPEGIIWEDTSTLAVFCAYATKIYYINVPLYYQVVRANSTSRNQYLSRKEINKSIRDYLKNLQLIRVHKSRYTAKEWKALCYRFIGHFRDAWRTVLLSYSRQRGGLFWVFGIYMRLIFYCARYFSYQYKWVLVAWVQFLDDLRRIVSCRFMPHRITEREGIVMVAPHYHSVLQPLATEAISKDSSFRVIGVWLAMHYPISKEIYREGIMRHLFFVMENLLRQYPFLRIELWCVDINAPVFKTLLEHYLPFYLDHISIKAVPLFGTDKPKSFSEKVLSRIRSSFLWHTLRSYKALLYRMPLFRKKVLAYKYNYDDPNQQFVLRYIQDHTRADIFYFTFSWGLGARLPLPKILIVHDLHTITHQHLFEKEITPAVLAEDNAMLLRNIKSFLEHNTHIITLTHFTREKQLFHLVPAANTQNTTTIYTPITLRFSTNIIDKKDLLSRWGLSKNTLYLFYPTQIRAQKNMEVVVRAVHYLRMQQNIPIYIFSTGNQKQLPELYRLIKKLKARPYYIELGSLTDNELYAFYAHALMGVAPSYTEGNFPLQAMESLAMQTPVALAHTDIVKDRCALLNNFPLSSIEKYLFDPDDFKQLAMIITAVMEQGKEVAFKEQSPLLAALQAYTWEDAATAYYECMRIHWLANQTTA